MNRSRRKFLQQFPAALSIPFTLAGMPVNLMAENALTKMARSSLTNDRVLVILQMHGGNDGLNCLIPVDDYELYYSKRANIAIPARNSIRKYIPLDSTLPPEQQVGLHPDMMAMKQMYDQGRVAVVQGVSYKNNNGSHFRGRDILFMGGAHDEYLHSGWVGRYLQQEIAPEQYPRDFPNAAMPDPLALEMGNDVSLIFHQHGNIPTSISITDPEGFAELVGGLEGFLDENVDPRGIPPAYLQDSPYYNELDWILSLEDKSKDYAQRLATVYQEGNKVAGHSHYPETYPFNAPKGSLKNTLTPQLQIIARLLSGGCKTKVFLIRTGGFDTHASQVEAYDPTMGTHAALMYHISAAMNAFQEDLRKRGLEDRVLTITTSEFGRRIYSNGSYGTDHGTGGPMFIFGQGVKAGVTGKVPDLTSANVEMQYDYRLIYGNIMRDWLLVPDDQLNNIFPGLMHSNGTADGVTFQELPLARQQITGIDDFIGERFSLRECFPNPVKNKTTIPFTINNTQHVCLNLYNIHGKKVKVFLNEALPPGNHAIEADLSDLPDGHYQYQLKSGFFQDSKALMIQK
ncbi:MAG: DUF1501 domain-containing protein [Chryseosolibacter sp.]